MSWVIAAIFLACLPPSSDKTDDSSGVLDDSGTSIIVDADGDGYPVEEDCNDNDGLINPSATERCNDEDDDCDGEIDEGFDEDGDGYEVPQFCADGDDCDDQNAFVHPGAEEIPYDGIDQDCDGSDLTDVDGDGFDSVEVGGDVCDVESTDIHPASQDIPKDGIDQDCDGFDLIDEDGDGYDDESLGGDDCDDANPEIHPGAPDWMNDNINNDCEGLADSFSPLTSLSSSMVGTMTSQEALLGRGHALCDLDADGLDDVVLSAPFGSDYSGQLGIFFGSGWSTWASGMELASADTVLTGETYEFMGFGLVCTDFNADGFDDLLVGSGEIRYASMNLEESAHIDVYFGGGASWPSTMSSNDADATLLAPMEAEEGAFVYGLGMSHGDFNGDGIPELVVSTGGDKLQVHDAEERIHILQGSALTGNVDLYSTALFTLSPDEGEDSFGSWSARAQLDPDNGHELVLHQWDWAQDGDPDGACDYDSGGLPDLTDPDCHDTQAPITADDTAYEDNRVRGSLDFFIDPMAELATAITPSESRTARFEGSNTYSGFGFDSVTGDFDGDGLNDLVVSAILDESSGVTDAGGFYAFSGINADLAGVVSDATTLADAHLYGSDLFGYLGTSLANAGDANGDGVDDLLVTESGVIGGGGLLWMLDGLAIWNNTTPLQAALLAWYGEDRDDELIVSSKTGDIDGDGLTDVLVLQNEWQEGNGRVFVLLSTDW